MTTTPINKSQVFTTAWQLVKTEDLSLSQALRRSWREHKCKALLELLRSSVLSITFRKVDGTVTTRVGTRSAQLVPTEAQPKGYGSSKSFDVIPFYSLSDHAWRSFRTDSIIRIQAA